MRIEDIDIESRPREQANRNGISSLTDEALMALLIGGGVSGHNALELAKEILLEAGDLASLSSYSKREFLSFSGIGEVKATQLLALFELHRRLLKGKGKLPQSIDKDEIFQRFYDEKKQQEEAILVLLSPSRKPLGTRLLYRGNLSKIPLDPQEVMKSVFSNGCRNFVLVHNHPSGCSLPSLEDMQAAEHLYLASKKIGIRMEDFMILGEGGCFSYKEEIGFR